MTEVVNIKRKRGNTRRIVFHFFDDTGDIDVSNFTDFKLSVNPSQYPKSDIDTVVVLDGYIIDGPTGRVGFTPDGTIPVADYFFDCKCLDDNNESYTFAEGTYKVTQGIS